ncbi:peptidase [Synergistales bacterium]|nr:peptidase [Synergistales bacterium]
MSATKHRYNGYKSFDYLGPGRHSKFAVSKEDDRVSPFFVPMTEHQEERLLKIIADNPVISLHDHLRVLPENITDLYGYYAAGRVHTGYAGIASSPLDAVFGNQVLKGASWEDTIHELGMRSCDAAHSGLLVKASGADDIFSAKQDGKIAWFPMIEHASCIGDELDKLDVLYGLGVRMLGLVFSHTNAIGGGLSEARDGGLTNFGAKVVSRMNALGLPIDLSHAGDLTTMDAINVSAKPVFIGHTGARTVWGTKRMKPDDVIKACADKGGIFGIEAAPHTTMSRSHKEHDIESVMEHFEYVKNLVGIDSVSFGPDTMFGDHVGLHRQSAAAYADDSSDEKFVMSEYVRGCENPSETWWNIPRWLIAHGYSDEDIAKVIGGNVIRVLKETF